MNNLPRTYKDLIFWQRSYETATLIIKLAKKLPQTLDNKIILNQLLRAIMSIGANIAEGYGRFGNKEFKRFLQIALGSANESDYWLLLLLEANISYQKEINEAIRINTETIKMLAASIKTIKNRVK